MGKGRTHDKEYSQMQKIVHENKKLKRENSSLRKQLARLDLDRFDTVREMIEEYKSEETVAVVKDDLDKQKQLWACHQKGCDGHLEIIVYAKMGSPHYYRKCSECNNRTHGKPYIPGEVKGPLRRLTEE